MAPPNTTNYIIERNRTQVKDMQFDKKISLYKAYSDFLVKQVSKTREGTGIGLAVSAQVFRLHDIIYFAKNVLGGVQMVIKVPVNREDE